VRSTWPSAIARARPSCGSSSRGARGARGSALALRRALPSARPRLERGSQSLAASAAKSRPSGVSSPCSARTVSARRRRFAGARSVGRRLQRERRSGASAASACSHTSVRTRRPAPGARARRARRRARPASGRAAASMPIPARRARSSRSRRAARAPGTCHQHVREGRSPSSATMCSAADSSGARFQPRKWRRGPIAPAGAEVTTTARARRDDSLGLARGLEREHDPSCSRCLPRRAMASAD
jgi:hypothetical protein